jgi:hypothetical protein
MSQLGQPTGMNAMPVPAAPVPPQITAVSGGSQYLRFKRLHQTIFLHCEPQEVLGAVKLRLSAILAVDELDLRLYECMTPERKKHVLALLEEKLKEAAKLRKKKPGEPKPNLEEEIRAIEIPPLPDEKKLWELGLENDSIVYFVYRTHPNTDWDEFESYEPSVTPGRPEGPIFELWSICQLLVLHDVLIVCACACGFVLVCQWRKAPRIECRTDPRRRWIRAGGYHGSSCRRGRR